MNIKTVTLRLKGMRKSQDFVVYPNSDPSQPLKIQSDTYIALVSQQSGKTILAGPHSSGAYFHHLTEGMPKRKAVRLDPEQLQAVIEAEAKPGQRIGANVIVGPTSPFGPLQSPLG